MVALVPRIIGKPVRQILTADLFRFGRFGWLVEFRGLVHRGTNPGLVTNLGGGFCLGLNIGHCPLIAALFGIGKELVGLAKFLAHLSQFALERLKLTLEDGHDLFTALHERLRIDPEALVALEVLFGTPAKITRLGFPIALLTIVPAL